MIDQERDLKVIEDHVAALMEHFDAVHIFASRHDAEEDTTISCNKGGGNWNARKGQVHDWLHYQDAIVSAEGIRDVQTEDD